VENVNFMIEKGRKFAVECGHAHIVKYLDDLNI